MMPGATARAGPRWVASGRPSRSVCRIERGPPGQLENVMRRPNGSHAARIAALIAIGAMASAAWGQIYVDGEPTVIVIDGGQSSPATAQPADSVVTQPTAYAEPAVYRRPYGREALGHSTASTGARIVTATTNTAVAAASEWRLDPWAGRRYHVQWDRYYDRRPYRSGSYFYGYGYGYGYWGAPIVVRSGLYGSGSHSPTYYRYSPRHGFHGYGRTHFGSRGIHFNFCW